MNTYKARVRAFTQEISQPLELHHTVVVLGKSEVAVIRKSSNNDGSTCYAYELKPLLMDLQPSNFDDEQQSVVHNPIIKQKSPSQRLKQLAFRIAQELGVNDQDLYEEAIEVAMEHLREKVDEEIR